MASSTGFARNPTGIAACCARAASGHAAAAPPSSVMNSRRLMPVPRLVPTPDTRRPWLCAVGLPRT
jgi:hypothetical protein